MKKLSRLMLVGIPFLAFSGLSLAAEDTNILNIKILSASTSQKVKIRYIKPEGGVAQPVSLGENKIYEGTIKVHTRYDALDENGITIYTWLGHHVKNEKEVPSKPSTAETPAAPVVATPTTPTSPTAEITPDTANNDHVVLTEHSDEASSSSENSPLTSPSVSDAAPAASTAPTAEAAPAATIAPVASSDAPAASPAAEAVAVAPAN